MIKDIVKKYLPVISAEESAADLGNRSAYIGASDISGCPRKAVLGKLNKIDYSFETLMVFQRGHIAEAIIQKSLKKSGVKFMSQYEAFRLINGEKDVRIKAHLDFLVYEDKKVTVVECKSSTAVREPYETWINQTIFQMGLIREIIFNSQEPETEVKGEIMVIDLKTGQIEEFEVKFNKNIFRELMKKAEYILSCVATPSNPDELQTERSMLCGFCNFRQDCVDYNTNNTELPNDLKQCITNYSRLNTLSKDIEKQKNIFKEEIFNYGKAFKTSFDGIKASLSKSKIKSLDTKALKENEPDIVKIYSYDREVVRFTVNG